MTSDLDRLPAAGERIVRAAGDLFYAEGIHAVGVDRVCAEAGVAKATLYQQFRSKDELVAACLRRRAEQWRASVAGPVLARPGSAARRTGAVFGRLGESFAAPGYRGCPFINAAAEYPGEMARSRPRSPPTGRRSAACSPSCWPTSRLPAGPCSPTRWSCCMTA